MQRNLTLLIAVSMLFSTSVFTSAQTNDAFANRAIFTGLKASASGVVTSATSEPGEPAHAGQPAAKSLWWGWTAPYDGQLQVTVTNAGFQRYRWALYTGNVLTNLSEIATNRTTTNRTVTISVQAGVEYSLAVDHMGPVGSLPFVITLHLRTLNLVQPAPEARVSALHPVNLLAVSTEPATPLTNVVFVANSNIVASSSGEPFAAEWIPQVPGRVHLTAFGTNSLGERRDTPPFWITVGPANDFFRDAIDFSISGTGTVLSAQNAFASAEPGEPAHNGLAARRSLWWRWVPAYSAPCQFRVTSPGGSRAISVYQGDAVTNLSVAASGSNFISFQAEAGAAYYMAVDGMFSSFKGDVSVEASCAAIGFLSPAGSARIPIGSNVVVVCTNFAGSNPMAAELFEGTNSLGSMQIPGAFNWLPGAVGEYSLTLRATNDATEPLVSFPLTIRIVPANDNFTNAFEIPSVANAVATIEGSMLMATHEPDEPPHIFGNTGRGSVWFSWVAPWSGKILFSTQGSQFSPWLAIYSGTNLGSLLTVAEGVDPTPNVVAGTRYFIAADATWGNEGQVRISVYPPPANNDFDNAFVLAGTSGSFHGTNLSANAEAGEPDIEVNDDATIWWTWTAPATGDLMLHTSDTLGMWVRTTVYQGTSVSNLATAAGPKITSSRAPWGSGSWSPLGLRVYAGQTYHFRFSGGDVEYRTYGGITASFSFTPLDIPTNDLFAGRIALTGLTNLVDFSNATASKEPGEPAWPSCDPAGRTVWFTYTAPTNGMLEVSADGSSTVWAIYCGTTITNLERLAFSCQLPTYLPVIAGENLQIAADGSFGYAGPLRLAIRLYPPPANDDFASSIQFEGTNFSVAGENFGATLEPGEQLPATSSGGRTVWYSWAAPAAGRVHISSSASMLNRALAVYTGTTISNLQRIASGQDSLGFASVEGQIYHIQLDGAADRFGTFNLNLQLNPFAPPANDHFTNAFAIEGGGGAGSAAVVDATLELGEPAHFEGAPCKSVWWRWQVAQNGYVQLNDWGSYATNVIYFLYQGSSLETLTLVASGSSIFLPSVRGGTVFYIAAVVNSEAGGDVVFNLNSGGSFDGTPAIPVPGNLLCEPSLEGTALEFTCWQLSTPGFGGGYVGERGGADGTTWIVLPPGVSMYQDVNTTIGSQYEVRCAFRPDFFSPAGGVRVRWNDAVLGDAIAPAGGGTHWRWTNFTAVATSTVSRVTFESINGMTGLDAFSVVPVMAPPVIITQPSSVSTFAGANATFLVGAAGTAPLAYQWYFNGSKLTGESNNTLSLYPVDPGHGGSYEVVVTNLYGSVTSAPAQLVVEIPQQPAIVLQPYSDRVALGAYFTFSVAAVGTPPLQYQWYFNGTDIPEATARHLAIPSVNETNVGTYMVKVWNNAHSVWSHPAVLAIDPTQTGGAALLLGNEIPDGGFTRKAWIYDTDGTTKLAGTNYLAQLYAGPSLAFIRAVGSPKPFRTGFSAGLIEPEPLVLPNVPVGGFAVAQVRVWEASRGASYEEARGLGGKFGKSQTLGIQPGVMPNPPPLWGLQSFSLQAGLPQFVAGRIEPGGTAENGQQLWTLIGHAGYSYSIEKQQDFTWRPVLVLTNISGTATFTDPEPVDGINLFRARILE